MTLDVKNKQVPSPLSRGVNEAIVGPWRLDEGCKRSQTSRNEPLECFDLRRHFI